MFVKRFSFTVIHDRLLLLNQLQPIIIFIMDLLVNSGYFNLSWNTAMLAWGKLESL